MQPESVLSMVPMQPFAISMVYGHRRLTARALGFDGKWCIHPDQLAVVNDAFTPDADEIAHARRVLDAYREATSAGIGAIAIGAEMIDAANLRMARRTLEFAGESEA